MRRPGRRLLAGAAVVAFAFATGLALAGPVAAHALRQSSYPDAGATLAKAPSEVRVTFGEAFDSKLSSLRVLDGSGRDQTTARATPIPGQLTLRVGLKPLPNGVYTVVWRTVSTVDGHLATGSFAFGVGVSPSGATTSTAARAPPPSNANVASRWLLYVGCMTVLGGPLLLLAAGIAPPRRVWIALAVGFAGGIAGAFGIAIDQLHVAGLATSKLFDAPFGHPTIMRALPLVVGAAALAVAWRGSGRLRRAGLVVVTLSGAAAMWGDVEASHVAAAHSARIPRMLAQWAHIAAAGVWIGGLIVLLLCMRTIEPTKRMAVVRRFSSWALGAVALIAATGVQRAVDEVGSWHQLLASTFGKYVVLKSILLVVLIGLGAVNRFRSVPAVARTLAPLRAVARAEVALVAIVLVAAAMLQGLSPPANAAKAPKPTVVTGHDFGTTVRVRLTVAPGTAGFNSFRLAVTDYDTAKPVDALSASLRFRLPARPDVAESTVALRRDAGGIL